LVGTTRVGDVVAQKYRIEELLGSGGMGHVYRAVNVRAGRAVAIKILRSEHIANTTVVDRFLREAMAANLVRHPNVVDVLDVDKDGDGAPFIVQELLNGVDLERYMRDRGGRLDLGEIEDLLVPIIDAIGEAHAQGVVHRDIKPENVFLASVGNRRVPKLLDFGISKIRAAANVKTTDVGMMMGTPAYMAPEYVQGASREADPRTDIWALGVMLWELLAGHLPFDASDAPSLFVSIATKDVPDLLTIDPYINPHVSRVIMRCLRRDPSERYPTAAELARDLRHVLAGTEIEPTQRRSLRPPAPPAMLDIPDLALPGERRAPAIELEPAANTVAHGALDLDAPPANPPPLEFDFGQSAPNAPAFQPVVKTVAMERPIGRGSQPAIELNAPVSRGSQPAAMELARPVGRGSQPAAMELARPVGRGSQPAMELDGVMHSGPALHSRRTPPVYQPPSQHPVPVRSNAPDFTWMIALAVVGGVTLVTSAILMTFAYSPEGWQVLGFFSKPSQPSSLIMNGGLGVVALIGCGATTFGAYKRWRGDIAGGHAVAIAFSVIAGGLLFAAMQLGRAAL
jgi:serine/threonine-protein kinase